MNTMWNRPVVRYEEGCWPPMFRRQKMRAKWINIHYYIAVQLWIDVNGYKYKYTWTTENASLFILSRFMMSTEVSVFPSYKVETFIATQIGCCYRFFVVFCCCCLFVPCISFLFYSILFYSFYTSFCLFLSVIISL